MAVQLNDFLIVLALAAFAGVFASQTSQIALGLSRRTERDKDAEAKKGAKAPWLVRLALGGGRSGSWTDIGTLELRDRHNHCFATILVEARHHERSFVALRVTDQRTKQTWETLAVARGATIETSLRDLHPDYAECDAAGTRVPLSLLRPNDLKGKRFRFNSIDYDLQVLMERVRRAKAAEEAAERRREQARSRATRPSDPAKAAIQAALSALPEGDFRTKAVAIANRAWSASAASDAKAARIAAAKLLHPDRISSAETAKTASQILAMINAKLDVTTTKDAA